MQNWRSCVFRFYRSFQQSIWPLDSCPWHVQGATCGTMHPWQKASSSAPQRSDQPQNLGQFGSPSSVLLGSCARPSQQIELSLRQSSLFVRSTRLVAGSWHCASGKQVSSAKGQWATVPFCANRTRATFAGHLFYRNPQWWLPECTSAIRNHLWDAGIYYTGECKGVHKNWKLKRGTSVPWSKHGISHVWSLHHHEGFLAIYNWYLNPLYYITMGPDDHPRLWLYK